MKATWKKDLRSELPMSLDTQLVLLQCQGTVTHIGFRSANSSSSPVMFSKTTHVCKVLQNQIQEVKGDAEEMCHEGACIIRDRLKSYFHFSLWFKTYLSSLHLTYFTQPSTQHLDSEKDVALSMMSLAIAACKRISYFSVLQSHFYHLSKTQNLKELFIWKQVDLKLCWIGTVKPAQYFPSDLCVTVILVCNSSRTIRHLVIVFKCFILKKSVTYVSFHSAKPFFFKHCSIP